MEENEFTADKIKLIMQLRRSGIRDTGVLSAMESVPREMFVPEALRASAYEDRALPIEEGQTISQPLLVAKMTEALELTKRCKVLEIGTGSGYQTAVMAPLCKRIYTVERHKELYKKAGERFRKLGVSNVVTSLADGSRGWQDMAPFERIIITACTKELPKEIMEQMSDGGLMIVPVGEENGKQYLTRIRKQDGGFEYTELMEVKFVPLVRTEI